MDVKIAVALIGLVIVVLAAAWGARGRLARRQEKIDPWEVGLLYGPNGFARELPPGMHSILDPFDRWTVHRVNTVPRTLPGETVEAISKDLFSFRVVVTPIVSVVEPRTFVEQTAGSSQPSAASQAWSTIPDVRLDRFSPALCAAVLSAVAARTLEEFLADPAAMATQVASELGHVVPGTRLDDLLLTGITLPPEVRKMFTEVERARREGLAGLERARAEQASLRALANAARNLADNPALANLRMLQVMENAKGAKTFVLGNTAQDPTSPQP